jgi:hypothetical protein
VIYFWCFIFSTVSHTRPTAGLEQLQILLKTLSTWIHEYAYFLPSWQWRGVLCSIREECLDSGRLYSFKPQIWSPANLVPSLHIGFLKVEPSPPNSCQPKHLLLVSSMPTPAVRWQVASTVDALRRHQPYSWLAINPIRHEFVEPLYKTVLVLGYSLPSLEIKASTTITRIPLLHL